MKSRKHSISILPILIMLIPLTGGSTVARSSDGLTSLGWMAGAWACEKWGGEMKEIWSVPNGNSMIGMFSHVKAGEPSFYEFMVIEKTGDGLRLYLRHFSPKSVSWEDKQSPLVFDVSLVSKNEAVFKYIDETIEKTKLTYKLEAPDKLTVKLEKITKGKTQVEVFNYVRAK